MAVLLEPACARQTPKFAVLKAPAGFLHKPALRSVQSGVFRSGDKGTQARRHEGEAGGSAARMAFLLSVTDRQIRVGAAWLDGCTQEEIADALGIDQATVSRELQIVRRAAARFGGSLHRPQPHRAHPRVQQMSDRLYKSL